MTNWAVYRLDYNANEFLVKKGLSKEQANRLAADYIAKGHHQHYWVDKEPAASPDFSQMLDRMLRSGSAISASIKVLLSQGATRDECALALMNCKGMALADSKLLVAQVDSGE